VPDPISLQDAVNRVIAYIDSKPGASSRLVGAKLQAPANIDPARGGGLGQPIDGGSWVIEVARDKRPGEALDPPTIVYTINIATNQMTERLGEDVKVLEA